MADAVKEWSYVLLHRDKDGVIDESVEVTDEVLYLYRMVEIQRYLYSIHTVVSNRADMLKDAIKSLRSSARGMFKGTDKDKEAHCDRMVRNFSAEYSRAKSLLTHINDKIATIDFAATQASRILKEKEFELKVNNPYMQKGQAGIYQSHNTEDEDDDNPIPAPYRRN